MSKGTKKILNDSKFATMIESLFLQRMAGFLEKKYIITADSTILPKIKRLENARDTFLSVIKNTENQIKETEKEISNFRFNEAHSQKEYLAEYEKLEDRITPLMDKLDTLHSILESGKGDYEKVKTLIKEVKGKGENIQQRIFVANTLFWIILNAHKHEHILKAFEEDIEVIKTVARRDGLQPWQVIMRDVAITEKQKSVYEVMDLIEEYAQNLVKLHEEFVQTEKDLKLPEINWNGRTSEERYGAFERVVTRLHKELNDFYIANQRHLNNTDAQVIYTVLGNVELSVISTAYKNKIALDYQNIANPLDTFNFFVSKILRPILTKSTEDIPVKDGFEYALYIMCLLQQPTAFFEIIYLA